MVAAASLVDAVRSSLPLAAENELRRYFNEAESAYAGLRSNMGAQLDRIAAMSKRHLVKKALEGDADFAELEPISVHFEPDAEDIEGRLIGRIDRSRWSRTIERRLVRIGPRHARTLERTYTDALWSGDRRYVEHRFGRLAPLVLSLAGESNTLVRACRLAKAGRLSADESSWLSDISLEADAMLGQAGIAYVEARRVLR